GVEAQTDRDFSARYPSKLIRGDFSLFGNSNVRLTEDGADSHNGLGIAFVDIDGDNETANSSSASLKFSTENGLDVTCTRVVFAGLYWSGRAQATGNDVSGPMPDGTWSPTRFQKNTVKLKRE